MEDLNRIKVVLVEKKRTNKWLSEQMGVTPSTVSKWCTNSSQPDLGSLLKISDLLEVDIRELIVREYKNYLISMDSKQITTV
jgi:transcriptional regulator with XRE-family HTH domain